jgi:hypothetical protein
LEDEQTISLFEYQLWNSHFTQIFSAQPSQFAYSEAEIDIWHSTGDLNFN